ncbi:NtaA/DmoA family FMN-dependent monooxygenase [Frondihabitans cladoniiphilus]|uniref:NtaA/DmoA family FMN-dependent monooxygenase n=1 Tax=Frondihabitans cladoniiphilus TaxID=715785 RepID=A0ABP8W3M0_9MICO
MFHLGWFVGYGYGVQTWRGQWSGTGATDWMKPDTYVDLVRSMERAGFDYVMFEDSSCIPDTHGGSVHSVLANAHGAPKLDPMTLVPLLAQATDKLGIVVTAATAFYPPYILARLAASLDQLSSGRVGMNFVTASSNSAARNFGLDQHFEHDHRYTMADEWTDVVTRLWESWEPDAMVHDRDANLFADGDKVHPIDFEGEFYKVKGPLQVPRSPQGRPVICQAGGSPSGRDYAAKWADTIITGVRGVDAMKAYRDDIRSRVAGHGRDPDDVKVLYLVSPVLDDTVEAAQAKAKRIEQDRLDNAEWALQTMSYASGIDFSQFDLDKPLPEVETNGHTTTLSEFAKSANGKTLREAVAYRQNESVPLIGTPETVADEMGEIAEAAGGDGFLIANELDRVTIAQITEGLAPALQRRGLTRTSYEFDTLRENLRAF